MVIKESMIECIEACQKCAMECSINVADCIGREGMERCVELCMDCTDICNLCATLCGRDSRFMDDIMDVCIDICEASARECERIKTAQGDICADACWACAEECRRVVA
jgi:hypothetical protein